MRHETVAPSLLCVWCVAVFAPDEYLSIGWFNMLLAMSDVQKDSLENGLKMAQKNVVKARTKVSRMSEL